MIKTLFWTTSFLYWVLVLARIAHGFRDSFKWERNLALFDRMCLLVFTGTMVVYIRSLEVFGTEIVSPHYDRPVSWLLFAWSIHAANLTSEVFYGNRESGLFANLWTALVLSFSPAPGGLLRSLFSSDFHWLGFHRLFFLLGYAFCLLALPLVILYFVKNFRFRITPEDQKASLERSLWKIDRDAYVLILLALPLLTMGIIFEALHLFENKSFPTPEEIWSNQLDVLLALATWFICGIYLHSRMFFGWKYAKAGFLYLAGFFLMLFGHFLNSTH